MANNSSKNTITKFKQKQDKSARVSIVEIIKILETNGDKSGGHARSDRIIINFSKLRENYCRQTVKRTIGYRSENGDLIEPWLKTESIDESDYADMGRFAINHNTATINMLLEQRVKLIKAEDETQAIEVAGLLLNDLKTFKNYTIVKEGKVNIKSLQVKISSKKVFDLLQAKGVLLKDNLPATEFDFRSEYTIRLDNLPIVPLNKKNISIDGLFEQLAEIKVISSIISACLKQNSDIFVTKQLTELKANYISPNLYLNFPTTKSLEVTDIRKSQKIDIGSKEILNLFKLYSANKFLERRYQVYDTETGEIFTKPTFDILFEQNIACRQKSLSSRMKVTKVDELMKPIFDDFLGIENNGRVIAILSKVHAKSLVRLLQKRNKGKTINKQDMLAAMRQAQTQLKQYAEKIYRDKISPLVLYIGSTGMLPKCMQTVALSANELAAKYPDLQFSRTEKEGRFFEVGESIISVYTKDEYCAAKSVGV